jgi:hypothetical protein
VRIISAAEREKTFEYHKEGHKTNQIVPIPWAELGTVCRSGTIQKVIDDAG